MANNEQARPRTPRRSRPNKLGRQLTAERLRRGLDQASVAEHLGVGLRSLIRWETGDGAPRDGTLQAKAVESFLRGE